VTRPLLLDLFCGVGGASMRHIGAQLAAVPV
jgi:hypothetical protein